MRHAAGLEGLSLALSNASLWLVLDFVDLLIV